MAGKNYQIDFSAADPLLYSPLFYEQIETLPVGRASAPLVGAADSSSVESLAPSTLALGQVVPFEFRICLIMARSTATPSRWSLVGKQ